MIKWIQIKITRNISILYIHYSFTFNDCMIIIHRGHRCKDTYPSVCVRVYRKTFTTYSYMYRYRCRYRYRYNYRYIYIGIGIGIGIGICIGISIGIGCYCCYFYLVESFHPIQELR